MKTKTYLVFFAIIYLTAIAIVGYLTGISANILFIAIIGVIYGVISHVTLEKIFTKKGNLFRKIITYSTITIILSISLSFIYSLSLMVFPIQVYNIKLIYFICIYLLGAILGLAFSMFFIYQRTIINNTDEGML